MGEHMQNLETLCEALDTLQLRSLNEKLKSSSYPDSEFKSAVSAMNTKLESERMDSVTGKANKSTGDKESGGAKEWTSDELALLIKAVNLFPAGTVKRWEVVANFINQHSKTPEITRYAKETLAKAKELQSGNHSLNTLKDEVNKKAYENLEKQKKRDVKVDADGGPSQRHDSAAEVQGLNVAPWTPEEQQLLEQALKTYPSSLGSERWEKIQSCIPNRSKKDCMKRYKELAEIVRAKKAAMAAAQAKK